MFPVYCAALIAAVFIAIEIYYVYFSFTTILYGVIGALFGFCLGLFITIIFYSIYLSAAPDKTMTEYKDPIPLLNMKDVFNTEEESYLLQGNFSSERKYMFIYQHKPGHMKGILVDSDEAYIEYTTDDTAPYVQPWKITYKNKVLNHLFFDVKSYYTFYIPDTSIVMDITNVEF